MRLRPGIGGIPVAVPVIGLLAACGSSSPTSSSAAKTTSASVPTTATAGGSTTSGSTATPTGNFDSCGVVSQREAAAALAQPVTAGVLGSATIEGGLACAFHGPSSPTPHTPNAAQPDSIRVVVVKGPNARAWYTAYKSSPVVRAAPISGYGDRAFYDGYASLSILKTDTYVRIAVSPAGAPPSLADEERLATAILPRL